MDNEVSFGNYVKSLREEKGKNLSDVADKARLSISHIFRIEEQKRKVGSISISTIKKLAKGLEVDPLVLLEMAMKDVEKEFMDKENR